MTARSGVSRRCFVAMVGAASVGTTLAAPRAAPADIVALAASPAQRVLFRASRRSLSRSDDNARTWHELEVPLPRRAAIAAVSVSKAGAMYLAGSGLGVLHGDAAGTHWRVVSRGLPRDITAVAAHAQQPDTVYAYAPGRGIYRSEDAGVKWRLMDAGPRGGITQFLHSDMPGSMQTGWLFVAGPQGVRLSMDCFCGWRSGGEVPAPARALAFDPHRPARILAAAGQGLFETGDGAQAWSELPSPGAPVQALAVDIDGGVHAAIGAQVLRLVSGSWKAPDA